MDRINDTNTLDKATAYVILRMGRLLRMDLSRTLQQAGVDITPEQWFILFRLYEQDGLAQSELADKLLHDHPNITRLVDALEASGLIRRDNDPEDRRRYLIRLTDPGRALVEKLFPLVIARRQQLFKGLDEQAIEQLHATLKTIEQNLM